jgi:flagellar motor switch protein FliN/FliY
MSEPHESRLESIAAARTMLDGWVESLGQVLESMTDQKGELAWQPSAGAPFDVLGATPEESEVLWWEQQFRVIAGAAVSVAAPRGVWEYAGTQTLKAAGLENVESSEARNTWFEIVGQSLAVIARALTALMGRDSGAEPGAERQPATDHRDWASVSIAFGETRLPPLFVAFSPELLEILSAPPQEDAPEQDDAAGQPDAQQPHPFSRTMDLLMDVDLPISISFGRTQLAMKDVLKLTTGSIVELNRGVNDTVEVLVNHSLIARGEVVVVEGNYGVRIQEIASRQDRLRSIR